MLKSYLQKCELYGKNAGVFCLKSWLTTFKMSLNFQAHCKTVLVPLSDVRLTCKAHQEETFSPAESLGWICQENLGQHGAVQPAGLAQAEARKVEFTVRRLDVFSFKLAHLQHFLHKWGIVTFNSKGEQSGEDGRDSSWEGTQTASALFPPSQTSQLTALEQR